MDTTLRNRLIAIATTAALAGTSVSALNVAGVLGDHFEGTGPTVKKDGALYYRPYIDPVGILTVCRGVTGKGVTQGRLYTGAECAAMEGERRAVAEAAVKRNISRYSALNPWIQGGLIDFFYNAGEKPATVNSTLVRKFNRGDIDGGCRELVRWVNGRVNGQLVALPGLVNRRGATQELCLHWGRPGYPGGASK